MMIAVPKEILPGEKRVAITPDIIRRIQKIGLEVSVESGAGFEAFFSDSDYEAAGATVVHGASTLLSKADIVVKVQRPLPNETTGQHESEMIKEGAIVIALLQPLSFPQDIEQLSARKISAFSMELVPRITRAQQMDILSSMSSLAGYKAVLLGAAAFGKFVPMMTTAAGSLPPAKVLILGAGVAGLQAIATAKRLGAIVEAFDTRPAVKEQVESLGASFVELELDADEMEDSGGYAKSLSEASHQKEVMLIQEHAKTNDLIITTALIPGKKAPILITSETVKSMKTGSVIIDLAAEHGGNCELTVPGKTIEAEGVTIIGVENIASSIPIHASQMIAKNMANFLKNLFPRKTLNIDLNDEITKGSLVTHQGEILNDAVKAAIRTGGA